MIFFVYQMGKQVVKLQLKWKLKLEEIHVFTIIFFDENQQKIQSTIKT